MVKPPSAADAGKMKHWIERIDSAMAAYLAAQREDYLQHAILTPLCDDLTEFVCRPGKRLRPLLFLLAYDVFRRSAADRGATIPEVAESELVSVAVSLEFLHAFILIHDDIIDRSEARLPDSVQTQLGTLLLACMVETGFGEVADIIHSTRDVSKVSVPEIEEMYLLKTTRYTIECPLAMAAVLAGAGMEELATLARIARPAGLAFQIQNDLQEFARFEVSDAEIPADILEGKKTMLMRTAFDRLNETDRSLLQMCLSAGTPSDGTVSMTRDLVAKSGAVGQLSETMASLFAEADAQTRATGNSFFCEQTQDGLMGLIRLVRGATARC